MKQVIYKDIAKYTNKTEGTIKHWKRINPDLLELTKLGAFCKKNNITIEKIKKCVELQELVKGENGN
jgi:hypothetical protein